MRKRIFWLNAGLFLLVSSVFLFSARQPKIKFSEELKDFQKVKQGDVLTHEFVIRNEGDAVLTIRRVDTSCGCTAVLLTEKTIAPGKEGRLKVTFNTQGYAGKVDKYIYIESDDPSRTNVQLTVSAEIEVLPQPKIDIDRYNLDLGLFLQGEEVPAAIKIKNVGELELRVESPNEDVAFYAGGKRLSFPLRIPAGKSLEVEMKIRPQNRLGLVREYVLIRSNDPVRSTISLYVTGYILTKEQLKELFNKYKDIIK